MVNYSGLLIFLSVFVHIMCGIYAENERSLNSIDNDVGESLGFGHCDDKDTSLSCQSIRIARNVLHQLIKARKSNGVGDFKIVEGVELVSTQNLAEGGRSLNDGTISGKVAGFLQNHELRVKLPDLLGREEMKGVVSETLRSFDEQSDFVETGRRKGGKGGGGAVMLMGMMMAKMLAAIGFGGLGLLTMKALMVSALALMLSAIIGVKKLASSGGDHDGGHQVHYVQASHGGDHHRRKRMAGNNNEIPLPYRGWAYLAAN